MSRYLDMVDDPSHVKKLTVPQLSNLAEEIRHELITKLAASQHEDGSWSGNKRWMESNRVLVTAYAVLALQEAQRDLQAHSPKTD